MIVSSRTPIQAHSWQAASFQRSPLTYCLRRRSPFVESCLRRNFFTSGRGLVQKQKNGVPPIKAPKPLPKSPQALLSRKPAIYESLNTKLATRGSPTLLYQAASYTYYRVACYVAGGFILGIAVFQYRSQYYAEPESLPAFVPIFYAVGCFMMACGGFWLCMKPNNMIQTINSVPSLAKSGSRSLLLRIERTPLLPFTKPRITTVPPADVTLSSPLFDNDSERRIAGEIKAIELREARLRAQVRTHLMTLPFRQANYWIWRFFVGTRRAFSQGGFLYLHIKGNNRVWKMEKDQVWALDDGRALDRLVKIKLG